MWLSCHHGRKLRRIIGCKTKLNWNLLKGVSRLYNLWADSVLQAWLFCSCLLNCINTCTIWFLSKWLWGKSQKHWDIWQERSQLCCSDCSFMFSILEIGQSIHQWQQIFNKKHGKSHMEMTCFLLFPGWRRKLIFHPRHAFGLSSYKYLCFFQMVKGQAQGSCINTKQC